MDFGPMMVGLGGIARRVPSGASMKSSKQVLAEAFAAGSELPNFRTKACLAVTPTQNQNQLLGVTQF